MTRCQISRQSLNLAKGNSERNSSVSQQFKGFVVSCPFWKNDDNPSPRYEGQTTNTTYFHGSSLIPFTKIFAGRNMSVFISMARKRPIKIPFGVTSRFPQHLCWICPTVRYCGYCPPVYGHFNNEISSYY